MDEKCLGDWVCSKPTFFPFQFIFFFSISIFFMLHFLSFKLGRKPEFRKTTYFMTFRSQKGSVYCGSTPFNSFATYPTQVYRLEMLRCGQDYQSQGDFFLPNSAQQPSGKSQKDQSKMRWYSYPGNQNNWAGLLQSTGPT